MNRKTDGYAFTLIFKYCFRKGKKSQFNFRVKDAKSIPGLEDLNQPDPSTVVNPKSAEFNRRQCMREIARLMGKINDSNLVYFYSA